jgi:hypothetical protein
MVKGAMSVLEWIEMGENRELNSLFRLFVKAV